MLNYQSVIWGKTHGFNWFAWSCLISRIGTLRYGSKACEHQNGWSGCSFTKIWYQNVSNVLFFFYSSPSWYCHWRGVMVEKTTTRGSQVFKHVVKKKKTSTRSVRWSFRQSQAVHDYLLHSSQPSLKMLWLSWFRMAQASIFSAVPCTVFMCHLCETIMCWTTECSSPGHEKTTKPSKIRLVSEYVKKTWYKACSTTVCQVCDTSDRKQGRGFLTMRQGQVASRWRISPRPEHRDNMGGS